MEILLIFPGFILFTILLVIYEMKFRKFKPRNKVHFYVARDKDALLNLWINKPSRGINAWCEGERWARHIAVEGYFKYCGLNPSDYDNLKWEDKPVEVFLNLDD